MNYKQLNDAKKAQIDILLATGKSMREVGKILGISHSTISRYKSGIYHKRTININEKHGEFLDFLCKNYDWKNRSIEVCVNMYKKYYPMKPCVTTQQVYNWINKGLFEIHASDMCYKRRRRKHLYNMMTHTLWNLEHKTVLPIRLRPKYIIHVA